MVHRAPDSRLLTNLIAHEKEYGRHLAALFPLSRAALASLSAFAAASPSSPAQSIAAVVDALAGADDALQRYNHAIDVWRDQLLALKDLEDDLAAVLRDRDILVTRLIKASKSTRDAHRSSRLITPLTSLGSPSLSSLPSTNSTATGSASGPASTNAKLAQAQAELQACEAHLVAKEHELDARRISIARDGLGARCRALIDCGWLWGEMGKQGLKALQALSHTNGSVGYLDSKPLPTPTSAPLLCVHPTYPSDSSSLTPSQSASQTAARSAETSHEGPTSKEHGQATEPEVELQMKSKTQTLPIRTEEAADLTITLPPAHAISELAVPTGVRSKPLPSGDPAAQKPPVSNATIHPKPAPAPAPRRKGTKRSRRPPSQHITEVSDEGSDGPSSTSNRNANANTNPLVARTPFPTTRADPGANDTSSESDHHIGPFQVVENDPFQVIRRSMLSPSASALFMPTAPIAPSARASAPDVRDSARDADETVSPSKPLSPSSSPGSGQPAKRERRTSMAFFGSLRGLFRKPKERDRVVTDWDQGRSSPSPNQTQAKANGRGAGWVTRTDARIKGRKSGVEESDDEPTPTTSVANVGRRASRLRKGRPGAQGVHGNGSTHSIPGHTSRSVRVDGWVTDDPAIAGVGSGIGTDRSGGAETGAGRSRTRRGMVKQRKMSVADLRGSDQGHTDGEVGRLSLERASSNARGRAPEAPSVSVSGSKPNVDVNAEGERELARRGSTYKPMPIETSPTADINTNANASPGAQPRRATTTTASSSRKPSSDTTTRHRRSSSLSFVDTHAMSVSTSMSTQAMYSPTAMSWRKPPPQAEPPFSSQPSSSSSPPTSAFQTPPSQTPTRASPPKPHARRHVGNGHAHTHKHVQNQSLMSIVADVTRQNQNRDGDGVTRSFDVPRAPRSVLSEVERDRDREVVLGVERGTGTGTGTIGRGHARSSSSPTGMGEDGRELVGQGQGGRRPIKLPLRSALRNASRTPSPSPASVPTPVAAASVSLEVNKEGVRADAGLAQAQVEEDQDRGQWVVSPTLRDSASISSYATGRESLNLEEQSRVPSPSSSPVSVHAPPSPPPSRSPSPPVRSQSRSTAPRSHTPPPLPLSFTFPPPPVDPPPVRAEPTRSHPNPNMAESLPPSSSASAETAPVRRKSVRVSLPPTFSPTPPALYDEDGEGYAPWSASFSTRDEKGREREGRTKEREGRKPQRQTRAGGDAQEDVWADSSEEDEAYSRARRMLSLVGKQDKSAGKGKARAKT